MEGRARNRGSIGKNMSSRQPFRNIKQSPWKGSSGMNEKTLTDNLRVLVKPTAPRQTKEQNEKVTRPMSPFRSLKPPFNGSRMSPWRRRNEEIEKEPKTKLHEEEPKMKLHETEISIFQQLCLDKHDENAAIEILLESTESSIPEIYTESSESTDQGSRGLPRKKTGSVEGKRKFLDRLFFKSQRKSQTESVSSSDFLGSSKESNNSMSHSSNTSDEPNIPTPPSSIPRTRITVEDNSFPETSKIAWTGFNEEPAVENRVERTRSTLDVERSRSILDDFPEGGDTISNISSLSGTRASSLVTPVNFNRHESLGFESIKDIRKCLKEMERQLGQATNKGQRVSRQKVMRALFTVADSLEDDEEKSYLKKELKTSMETKKEEVMQPVSSKTLKIDSSDDEKSELTTSDDEDFTLDSGTVEDENSGKKESPFNIVSSVGNFFGVDSKNQHAVEEVLDDLLWTEFVSSRQQNTHRKKSNGAHSRSNNRSDRSRKSSMQAKNHKESRAQKDRSWWRNHPSKEEEDVDYDDDEYSSSSSEDEFKSYLPTSITVKRRYKKPTKLEDTFPRSISNPHYRVKLVDTESRLGYEMDHTSRRSPVL